MLHNLRTEVHIPRTQVKWGRAPTVRVPVRNRQADWTDWRVLGSNRNFTSVIKWRVIEEDTNIKLCSLYLFAHTHTHIYT